MMFEYIPQHRFKAIYVVDLCGSLCKEATKKVVENNWTNVRVVEADACAFKPNEAVNLVTFSYALSSEFGVRPKCICIGVGMNNSVDFQ